MQITLCKRSNITVHGHYYRHIQIIINKGAIMLLIKKYEHLSTHNEYKCPYRALLIRDYWSYQESQLVVLEHTVIVRHWWDLTHVQLHWKFIQCEAQDACALKSFVFTLFRTANSPLGSAELFYTIVAAVIVTVYLSLWIKLFQKHEDLLMIYVLSYRVLMRILLK